VSYVVIGGVAARLHDTGHATVDIDVCPSRGKANLTRLASALSPLGARLRLEGDIDGVEFQPHADLLANVTTKLTCNGSRDDDELWGWATRVAAAGDRLLVVSVPEKVPVRLEDAMQVA